MNHARTALVSLSLLALAASASAQDHTGTWQLTPGVNWNPFAPCGPIIFDQLVITDTNPTATVDTIPGWFNTMTGTTNGTTLSASYFDDSGTCDYTYSVSLTFTSPTTFTGSFDIDIDGIFFCGCKDEDVTFFFTGTCVTPAVSYCTPGTSENGCAPTMSATGGASASAPSGFLLRADAAEGAKTGIFFYGTSGRQANPWGSGTSFQCVVPPVMRGGLLTGTGTPGQCDGTFIQDLNARWCPTCTHPLQNPGFGAVVQAQLWYRDPGNTSNQTTSLSDAIEFTVCN